MFRDVVRFKQKLSEEECRQVLREEKRGVLALAGDDGYPYTVPINHWYNDEDGKLYFHSGASGHKIDAIRACDKASFCVIDRGESRGDWSLYFKSVVVFGRVRIIEDHEWALVISRRLSRKFIQDEEYIEREIRNSGGRVLCFVLEPEHITGKLVHES